jgi:hypothetical protein
MLDGSKFQMFKKLINKTPIGETISRKNIINDIGDVDSYKAGLIKGGFIEMVRPGVYKKLINIPDYINSTNYRDKNIILKMKLKLL